MFTMLCPAVLSTGCASAAAPDPDIGQAEENLNYDETDWTDGVDMSPQYDTGEAVGITGTYVGESTVTEAEYFKVKSSQNFRELKVGTTEDITIKIFLEELSGQYYINGDPAEKTVLQHGNIHLESVVEYEGSMSLTATVSLTFLHNGEEVSGTLTNITYIWGVVAANEVWSVEAVKQ